LNAVKHVQCHRLQWPTAEISVIVAAEIKETALKLILSYIDVSHSVNETLYTFIETPLINLIKQPRSIDTNIFKHLT